MSDGDLLKTVAEVCDYTSLRVDEIYKMLRPGLRLVVGLIITRKGTFTVSQSNTETLTNVANPAAATFYLAVVDLVGGTTLPSAGVSDPTKLTPVVGPLNPNGTSVNIGFYPIDANPETNDSVTGSITLAGNPDIDFTFIISGTPVPPETDTLDASSLVKSWPGAPTVPTNPQ
jgi:hypothetical protein